MLLSVHPLGKGYSLGNSNMFSLYYVPLVISRFAFVGRILVLILPVPGNCLDFTFTFRGPN